MSDSDRHGKSIFLAVVWILVGIAVATAAWLVPVNLKSVTPALLHQAGLGTPSVAKFGRQLLDSEKFGPAELVLAAARLVDDADAPQLDRAIHEVAARRPELVPWGGWDPFLDPLFSMKENSGRKDSTPVLTFFITESARKSLRTYLSNSRSDGVLAVLHTRDI